MADTKTETEVPGPARRKGTEMIRTLAVIATMSGILIVTAFQATLPTIKKNKARVLRQAVLEVIPGAVSSVIFRADADGTVKRLEGEDEKAKKFYAAYDASGKLLGVAVLAHGQGFQDVIRIIYGYSPEAQNVVGMKVLESKETPGLGDGIEKNARFRANFRDLDVALSADGERLEHEIEVVKKGKRIERWQIDTITGATISSKAVGRMMKKSAAEEIPLVYKNLDAMKEARP